MKYIPVEKLIAEIERRKKQDVTFRERSILIDIETAIASLQQEQPDTCIFGNTPSESSCKFCGVECALREPKQTGTASAGLSSKDEAIGLAIMAYLDTKVKHDNAKVCGVSLKVAREWIREKIAKANKQKQPEVDLEKELDDFITGHDDWDDDNKLASGIARHFYELGLNAGKKQLPEIELNKFTEKVDNFKARYKHPESISIKGAMAFMARMFYQYPDVARKWYEQLPKATMD